MDVTTLNKANDLNRKIREFSEALNCFEWNYENQPPISTNPQLIIEFDGDGREQIKLPMNLNSQLIDFLKKQIKKELEKNIKEFNELTC